MIARKKITGNTPQARQPAQPAAGLSSCAINMDAGANNSASLEVAASRVMLLGELRSRQPIPSPSGLI
jgi:hypothetical protein